MCVEFVCLGNRCSSSLDLMCYLGLVVCGLCGPQVTGLKSNASGPKLCNVLFLCCFRGAVSAKKGGVLCAKPLLM